MEEKETQEPAEQPVEADAGAAEASLEANTEEQAPAAPAGPASGGGRVAAQTETARRRPRLRAGRAKARERKPIVRLPKPPRVRAKPKERRGVVVSDAMDKTIVVRIETVRPHPVYKKVVRRSKKIHVHDPENRAKVGDVVRVVSTRPLSKTKTWRLAEIVEEAK